MSPIGDKATATRRPHDAEASRRALLDAARRVFDEVGYDRATTREIGERAGVDPALISAALQDNRYHERVARDLASGQASGVTGTPGLTISASLTMSQLASRMQP